MSHPLAHTEPRVKLLPSLWRMLDHRQRRQLVALQFLSVAMAFSTVGSIAAVVPFFTVLADPEAVRRNVFLRSVFQHAHFASVDSFLMVLGVAFVGIVLLANLLNLLGNFAIDRFALAVGDTLHVRVFNKILHRDYDFHLRANNSTLMSNVLDKTKRVTYGILLQSLVLVANIVTAIFIATSIFIVNPVLAVGATLALAMSYATIYAISRGSLLRNGHAESRFYAERAQVVNDSLHGIKELIVLRVRHYLVQRFAEQCEQISRTELNTLTISRSPKYVLECVAIFGLVSVALYLRNRSNGVGPWAGQLSFIALSIYRLLPVLQQAFSAIASVRASRSAFDGIAADLHEEREEEKVSSSPHVSMNRSWDGVLRCDLSLHSVSYRYAPNRPAAIRGASLSVPAGATVGLVGANGSGKTTLVDVMTGLLFPQHGYVEVDGHRLGPAVLDKWRSTIAYAPQNVFLIDATIAENIALGIPIAKIEPERLENAVRLARLNEFIAALPNGLNEMLGPHGCRISGGQRQLLGLARALYRESSLLILDEASSALDTATEEEITDMLATLRPKKTVILIAHRLSALRHCDAIYEMRNGRLERSGPTSEIAIADASVASMRATRAS